MNTNLNAEFRMTRFIDCSALKYSKSLNFPIPGFTALDHVKKIPVINPVNNMAEAKMSVSVFIGLLFNKIIQVFDEDILDQQLVSE